MQCNASLCLNIPSSQDNFMCMNFLPVFSNNKTYITAHTTLYIAEYDGSVLAPEFNLVNDLSHIIGEKIWRTIY